MYPELYTKSHRNTFFYKYFKILALFIIILQLIIKNNILSMAHNLQFIFNIIELKFIKSTKIHLHLYHI